MHSRNTLQCIVLRFVKVGYSSRYHFLFSFFLSLSLSLATTLPTFPMSLTGYIAYNYVHTFQDAQLTVTFLV